MFRLALVNPNKFEGIASAAPPINLGILASYVNKYLDNVDIKIIDGITGVNIKKELLKWQPDLVGLTSTTPTILRAYELADWIRENIDAPLVMGGVHVSIMKEEALEHCDYVVVGEGEIALVELINNIRNKIPTDKILERPYIKNLDDIPSPAWHLMNIEFYINVEDNTSKTISYTEEDSRALTILTSRGCPYKCIFCHNSWKRTPTRYHSAERVVEDLAFLYNRYNITSFFFGDDEFILNKERFEKIAQLLKQCGLDKKITWGCQARADILLKYGLEYVKLTKEVGCNLIAIGCESGNERMLQLLKCDSTTVKQNKDAINLCKQAGVRVCGSFMIGTPSETKEEMLDTLNFIKEAGLDSGGIGIATPFPGTKLWQIAKDKGLLPTTLEYEKYRPNIAPEDTLIICDTMPRDEFVKLFNDISRQVGETIYFKKLKDNEVSLFKTAWTLLKKKPWAVLSYPFRHPIKSFIILKNSMRGKDDN